VPAKAKSRLVSRIKVMARLDIAEKRLPQDGRISLTLGGRGVDVRVSTLPSRHGERVVMRILDKDQAGLKLQDLGMSPEVYAAFEAALREPNGIILVTGPTGSGKTTSLYAGLGLLNDARRNILTIEDPVEYAVHGVGEYWIIDTESETVEQYLPGPDGYELKVKAATGTITSEVIAGLSLPVRAIFDEVENLAALRLLM
jgi:type II secretory ATPase GspE/PulE/Tfp pilus assembly ATPase PilB-like protein